MYDPPCCPVETTDMSPAAAVTVQGGDSAVTGAVLATCTWPREIKSASADLKEIVSELPEAV